MSVLNLKKYFMDIFRNRMDNNCRYLSIWIHMKSGDCVHSFTDKNGREVNFPRELMSSQYHVQPYIDLKEHKFVGWKKEYGFMHMKFDVGCSAQYRLHTDNGEWFCILETWPPEGVVPCNTLVDELGYRYIEFDVLEDGTVTGWPETPDFNDFMAFGDFNLIDEDKKWVIEQVNKKDAPDGNQDIKEIPYDTAITIYGKDDEEIAYAEFHEILAAMKFLREQSLNPNAYFIHTRTFDGWNSDFWREGIDGCEDYCNDSFEDIESWIEEEKVCYIKRRVIPDSLDLELEEIHALCTKNDDADSSSWDESEDLPF